MTAANLTAEEWLVSLEKLGLELVSGKCSFDSFLKCMESCPLEVRSNPANKFEPRRRELVAALNDYLLWNSKLSDTPLNPFDSQVRAIGELIAKNIGIDGSSGKKYVAAVLPLRRAVANIQPIDGKLLEQFDSQLFAMLKFREHRREFPASLEARVRLAAQKNDAPFFVKLGKALSKAATFNLNSDLEDFKLMPEKVFLLQNWNQIESCRDKIGLCDFTWPALEDFFLYRFIYEGSVRDLARDACPGLQKSKTPKVKRVQKWKGAIWQVGFDGNRICELSRVES